MENNSLDIEKIRKDFPILHRKVHNKPLVYLDNAATSQKPYQVINAITEYYGSYNSNIHRGVHHLSQLATEAYDNSRKIVSHFLNAENPNEIVFVKGATDAINLVANAYVKNNLQKGDEILITLMEHHSNIVPWQMICEEKGAVLKAIPVNDKGELMVEELDKLLSYKTKMVAVTHVSNMLGTINDIKLIIEKAHSVGAKVLIDGCQSVQHIKVDVKNLDCDFYCFSGHKIYAPTGIGVLYGKEKLLNEMQPYQGGGGMIQSVSIEKTTYACLPHKFEAGTPNIEGAIMLGKAIEYMNGIGLENIHSYEDELLKYATEKIKEIEGVKIIGNARHKTGVLSFIVDNLHPYDIGTLLDKMGVAVRTGHHCTQPLMDFYKIKGTVRASFAFYNTKEEIDIFIDALKKALQLLK